MTAAPSSYFCVDCNVFHIGRVCVEVRTVTRPTLVREAPPSRTDERVQSDVFACITSDPGVTLAQLADGEILGTERQVVRAIRALRFTRLIWTEQRKHQPERYHPGPKPEPPPPVRRQTVFETHGATVLAAIGATARTVNEIAEATGFGYATVDTILRGLRAAGKVARSTRRSIGTRGFPHGNAFQWSATGRGGIA